MIQKGILYIQLDLRSIEMPSKIYKLYILYKRTLLDFSTLSTVFFVRGLTLNNTSFLPLKLVAFLEELFSNKIMITVSSLTT